MIEILVVIVIVGMLAVIAVAAYGSARQRAKMDYTADALVSLVQQRQNLSKSGRQVLTASGEAGKPTCYGVSFSKDEKPYVEVIEAPYVSVDTSIDATRSDFCHMDESKKTPFDQFEDNKITEIEKFGLPAESILVMFRPPEARISFGEEKQDFTNDPVVTITFKSANGQEQRSFSIDVSSGMAERVKSPTAVKKPLLKIKPSLKNKIILPDENKQS